MLLLQCDLTTGVRTRATTGYVSKYLREFQLINNCIWLMAWKRELRDVERRWFYALCSSYVLNKDSWLTYFSSFTNNFCWLRWLCELVTDRAVSALQCFGLYSTVVLMSGYPMWIEGCCAFFFSYQTRRDTRSGSSLSRPRKLSLVGYYVPLDSRHIITGHFGDERTPW